MCRRRCTAFRASRSASRLEEIDNDKVVIQTDQPGETDETELAAGDD